MPVAELSRIASPLLADLADPTARCSITVRRGGAGSVAWRADVALSEDAGTRLLLCRLACSSYKLLKHEPHAAESESGQRLRAAHEASCAVRTL